MSAASFEIDGLSRMAVVSFLVKDETLIYGGNSHSIHVSKCCLDIEGEDLLVGNDTAILML